MALKFDYDMDKARDAIAYLASWSPSGIDIYTACKLLVFAEKYHLVRYGRTITGDKYFAMKLGPIPNRILRLLQMLIDDPESVPDFARVLTVDPLPTYPHLHAQRVASENLSESDIEALDLTLQRFGSKGFKELMVAAHAITAYKKAWNNRGNKQSVPMAFEDFFDGDADAVPGVLEEAIEDSQLSEVCRLR
jgi:Protein of unknown function (DUF4065)